MRHKHSVRVGGELHNRGMDGVLAAIVSGVDQYISILRNSTLTYHISLPPDLLYNEHRLGRGFREFVSKPNLVLDPHIVLAAAHFSNFMDIYEEGARSTTTPAQLSNTFRVLAGVSRESADSRKCTFPRHQGWK